ncbi:MAG TPA: ketopantoate reductase family protein [candidate division Zixibacteria bacterium]|nr:ketopantoate reductase family protein [candidate division Zixibacteria bacterium]
MTSREKNNLREILVIGAGAIGGITAAMLFKENIDVQVITRKGSHYDAIKKNGLIIEVYEEPFKIPIECDFKKLKNKFKHILVVVKNIDTKDVAKQLKSLITPESLVYSLQNGFGNVSELAEYVPPNQIVAGVIGWGATYLGNGKLRMTSSSGDFVLGFSSGKDANDPRLLEIKSYLDKFKPTILTNNIQGFRWAKLIVNSVIAPLGGLFGITLGKMIGDPEIGFIMGCLKEEGLLVADTLKIRLEKVDGLDIRNFFYTPRPTDNLFTRLKRTTMSNIIRKVGEKRHGKIYPSLLTDLQRGRKTEIDYLNGYICRKAKEVGLEVPINSFLVKAINEIEKGKRKTGLENLSEIMQIAQYSKEKIKEQVSS